MLVSGLCPVVDVCGGVDRRPVCGLPDLQVVVPDLQAVEVRATVLWWEVEVRGSGGRWTVRLVGARGAPAVAGRMVPAVWDRVPPARLHASCLGVAARC